MPRFQARTIGGGAQDAFAEIVAEAMLREEQARRAQQQQFENEQSIGDRMENARRFDLGQAAEATERAERQRVTDFNFARAQKQDDIADANRRREDGERGVMQMIGAGVSSGQINPRDKAGRNQLGAMLFEAGDAKAGLDTMTSLTPEEEEERAVRRAGRIAGAQASAAAQHRTPPRMDLTPGQKLSYTRQLRNDFLRETTAAREIATQFKVMDAGLEAARKGDMAAGSQAVLVTFQKILDPTSVVRESEYARSAAGQALLARIQGAFERVQSGGAGIPLNELEAFRQLAETFMQNAASSAQEARTQIDAIADEFGLDKGLITREVGGGQPAAAEGGGSAPARTTIKFDAQGKRIP